MDSRLNDLWGQIDYVVYAIENGIITKTVLGGEASASQTEIHDTDTITVLLRNGTHLNQQGAAFPAAAQYAVKWIHRASAIIGGKEVAIEAKQESILLLQKQLDKEIDSAKQQSLRDQIAALNGAIAAIYQGDGSSEGLYTLMRQAVMLTIEREDIRQSYADSLTTQSEIEDRFAQAMGDMLRDGY